MSVNFKFQKTAAADSNNTATVGAALELDYTRNFFISVTDDSGAHTTHIVTVQQSPDKSNWYNTTTTVAQLASAEGMANARYIRFKVSTAEGGASTIDVHLQAK